VTAAEKRNRSPYKCPECGKRLVDVGGYWGCLCRFKKRTRAQKGTK
jgi:ribosomal protein L37AE/L43A